MDGHGWQVAVKPPRRGRRRGPRIYASLNKRGEIALSFEAFSQLKCPASVALYYDAARRIIGVKYPVPLDRYFFPVRRYGRNGHMRIVRAQRLLKQFGIKIERTLSFHEAQIILHHNEPMLVLELGKADVRTGSCCDRVLPHHQS